MPRFFLALITALALAVPAKAQFAPIGPPADIPDTTFYRGEMRTGSGEYPAHKIRTTGRQVPRTRLFGWTLYGSSAIPSIVISGPTVRTIPMAGDLYPKRQDAVLYVHGDARYGFTALMQLYEEDDLTRGTIVLNFIQFVNDQDWTIDDDSLKSTFEHFKETGFLVLGPDTLRFKDAEHHYKDKRTEHTASFCATPIGVFSFYFCWPDQKPILKEADVFIDIAVGAARRIAPNAPTRLEAVPLLSGGVPVAGAVKLSWGIPEFTRTEEVLRRRIPFWTPEEQRDYEKRNLMFYEYRVLRDGDKRWKPVDTTELKNGRIESEQTIFGLWQGQRKDYVVYGLDPNGTYSFCVRAWIDTFGPEVCSNEKVQPVSTESIELPETTQLQQNYPNPFNPSTAIEWDLFAPMRVRLEVFDAIGRSVGVLVDGMRPAGTNTFRFDADGLPSGLYVYRLQAGQATLTRKMTLIR